MNQDATKSSKTIPLEIHEHQDSSSGTETHVDKQIDLSPSDDDARFWTRPKIKQYWHDGILYRSHSSSDVDTSVLFVDLLYVGIIAVNADTTIEGPTKAAFLRFCVTFLPTWKIWSDISILVSQFEIDNFSERSIILLILASLVGYTTNIHSAFYTTYAQLVAFYLAARIAVAIVTVVLAIFIPLIRPIMLLNLISIIVPMAFWVGSCFLDIYTREPLIWLAICWDMWGSFISVLVIRGIPRVSNTLGNKLGQAFRYFPAVGVQDRLQRVGAFVSLVFGYSVVGILYQSQSKFGLNAFFGKAVLGLVQAFCFNWIYFDVDEKYYQAQSAKRHTISAALWFNAHLPFIMSYTLSSAALSKLVVAHDCPNADPQRLIQSFEEKSEAELSRGLRWFYCGGLGTAFLFMGMISFARGAPRRQNERIPQIYRLALRTVVSIIWMCLSLSTNLNSLELIGITTSMTVFTLAVDAYGTGSKEGFLRENTGQYESRPVHRGDTVMGF